MRSTTARPRRGRTTTALLGAVLTAVLAGCGGLEESGPSAEGGSLAEGANLDGQSYVVSGKNFDEQLVLCQIALAALESAGAEVTDRCNLGGSDVTRNAQLAGDVDVQWEYTGTAWVSYLGETPIQDSQEQYDAVKQADAEQNQLVWLDRTPFNNTYAFAMTAAESDRLGITTLTQMGEHLASGQPGTMCVESEYQNRQDGLPGLQQTYGFTTTPQVLQTGVIYQATADGECLFGEVFTTDGRIPNLDLRVLEDDEQYHPLYNAAPVVRQEKYDAAPQIADVFTPITEALTEEVMTELNRQRSIDGTPERQVARDWLSSQGFIGGS